jgi:hypothetical protein
VSAADPGFSAEGRGAPAGTSRLRCIDVRLVAQNPEARAGASTMAASMLWRSSSRISEASATRGARCQADAVGVGIDELHPVRWMSIAKTRPVPFISSAM